MYNRKITLINNLNQLCQNYGTLNLNSHITISFSVRKTKLIHHHTKSSIDNHKLMIQNSVIVKDQPDNIITHDIHYSRSAKLHCYSKYKP